MAVPRHKLSKTKKRQRRSHQALRQPGRSVCAHCNAQTPPHAVCWNCGHYKGERKVEVEGL